MRRAPVVLGAVLAIIALASCGGGDSAQEASSTTIRAATTTTPRPTNRVGNRLECGDDGVYEGVDAENYALHCQLCSTLSPDDLAEDFGTTVDAAAIA